MGQTVWDKILWDKLRCGTESLWDNLLCGTTCGTMRPVGQKKYPRLDLRASEAQIERWKKLAERHGRPLPKFIRELLDRAAAREGIE